MSRFVVSFSSTVLALLTATAAQAETEPPFFATPITNTGPTCQEVSHTILWHSRHALGRRNLNEENRGLIGNCWLNGRDKFYRLYVNIGGLINSQRGDTFVAGAGFRLRTPEWNRLTFEWGYTMKFIHYEVPRRGIAYGVAPIEVLVGKVRLTDDGFSIGVSQHRFALGREKVDLYGLEVRISF